MPGRQTPPGKGGQNKPLFFGWVETEKNKQWYAHVAGKAQWYECHHVGKSKPCLHEVSGGELECPHCNAGKFCETIGYLPLYRAIDGKPCSVLVHADVRDVVDQHKYLDYVMIGRAGGQSDGVYVVRPMTKGPKFYSTLEAKNTEADIWPTLVRMWKIPALTEWDARRNGIKSGGVLHPPRATPTVPAVPTVPTPPTTGGGPLDAAGLWPNLINRLIGGNPKADDRTSLDRLDGTDGV